MEINLIKKKMKIIEIILLSNIHQNIIFFNKQFQFSSCNYTLHNTLFTP